MTSVYETHFSHLRVEDAPYRVSIQSPRDASTVSGGNARVVVATDDGDLVALLNSRRRSADDELPWWDPAKLKFVGGILPEDDDGESASEVDGGDDSGVLVCVRMRDDFTAFTMRAACAGANDARVRDEIVDDAENRVELMLQVGVGGSTMLPRGPWRMQAYVVDQRANASAAATREQCSVGGALLAVSPVTSMNAVDAADCTIGSCWKSALDRAGCTEEAFTVHAYGDPAEHRNNSKEYRMLHSALVASKWATRDPTKACVLVPPIDTLCLYNGCDPVDVGRRLTMLPHWDGGRRHVLFNVGDRRQRSMEVGRAALAESSVGATRRSHRAGFDITFPLSFYRCGSPTFAHLERFADAPSTFVTALQFPKRSYLLTFKGARYAEADELPHLAVRSKIRGLHNGRDVIIATYCNWVAQDCISGRTVTWHGAEDADCAAENARAAQYDFNDLLQYTQYALVLAGEGTHSYRLYEALGAGAVPVVLGAAVQSLPFPQLIDWRQIAYVVEDDSAESVARLPVLLRSIPQNTRIAAHIRGRRAFNLWLRKLSSHADATLLTLHFAMFGGQDAVEAGKSTGMPVCHDAWALWCWPGERSNGPLQAAAAAAALPIASRCDAAFSDGAAKETLVDCWRAASAQLGGPHGALFTHAADAAGIHSSLSAALSAAGRPFAALHASTMALIAAGWSYHMIGYDAQAPGPVPELIECADGERRPTIAVVSLCDYDGGDTALTALSMSNKLAYTRKHGYGLFIETERLDPTRPHAWGKMLALLKHAEQAEWLVWVDCDSFFMNMEVQLEQLLPTQSQCVEHENRAPDGQNSHFVVTEDAAMLNTGVFFVRNHRWSLDVLRRAYGVDDSGHIAPSPFENHPWWEQGALYATLAPLVPPTGAQDTWELEATRRRNPALGANVTVVPQKWMNSYPSELASLLRGPGGVPLHAVYTDGDLMVSFSGCRKLLGRDACESMLEEHWAAATA